MNSIYNTYRPEGFNTISSYLMIEDPESYIDFLKKGFYAEELSRTLDEENVIRNAILKIGNTCFMLGQAREDFLGMRTSFYLYTEDVDGLFANTIAQGCKEVFKPMLMDYGDYQGGVMDPAGNYWWISKREEEREYT